MQIGEAIFYGTSDGFVLFEGCSEVSFDEKGKVTVGTLANDTEFLLVDGKEGTVKYKSNTVVTFKDGGSSGTLANNSEFRPVGYSVNNAINDQADGQRGQVACPGSKGKYLRRNFPKTKISNVSIVPDIVIAINRIEVIKEKLLLNLYLAGV